MTRKKPERNSNSPLDVKSFYKALENAVGVSESVADRQSQHGKRWLISSKTTITTTQGSLYLYVENPTDDLKLVVEGAEFYSNYEVTATTYDEPTVDKSTFTEKSFRNTRSSVQKDPPFNLYVGTGDVVSISDKGREYIKEPLVPDSRTSLALSVNSPGYIVDQQSSVLLEVSANTNTDTKFSALIFTHEDIETPDLTELSGTN